jgi:pyruvate formate lyase activating enzyme
MREPLPLIFDIHRFALDDGPGIRTTVFLKGCPLSCVWCHNPESMRNAPEMAFHSDRCILCGSCKDACPEAAITKSPEPQIDRSRCTACGRCADSCPTSALRMTGSEYPLDELLEIIRRDRHFFDASGGGVTFSGGEPTLWMDYLGAALSALKSENVHTAIQTCGKFDYPRFSQKILPCTDLIMFDIKFIAATEHKRYTGQDNASILENFRCLTRDVGSRVLPRVPLVPEITATPDNLLEIASFLADLGYRHCDLLPYNPAGLEKRQAIGMRLPPHLPTLPHEPGKEDELRKLFRERLIPKSIHVDTEKAVGGPSPHRRASSDEAVRGVR